MDIATQNLIFSVLKVALVIKVLLLGVTMVILAERRFSAFMQDRLGPNRTFYGGLGQSFADGIKLILKEDVIPTHVDKLTYMIAPIVMMTPALMTGAVIPFGPTIPIAGISLPFIGENLTPLVLQVADINVGLLYFVAIASIGVYGIVMGGWAQNNKYSLLGALRASAQMVSYELPMGLALVTVVLMSGSLSMNEIVAHQQETFWYVLNFPAFMIFLITIFAETNRLPFDLAECEQELVAGYHTEYSSMKFGMFLLAEYGNIITSSALVVTLFFGGWDIPFVDESALGLFGVILSMSVFGLKTSIFIFIFIWVRWSLPRFRYDQLMNVSWKGILPLSILTVVGTAVIMVLLKNFYH
ncbi:MAG: NADH-quinone oxidoreductase subunit NuoH [Calditrichaeota bacterium]|nr:MAG: NADH-quinone oxidoreductase subunit NuoH [Calditrichota bacterium]